MVTGVQTCALPIFVFLAIFLDRVTAALGAPREEGSLFSLIKKR